MTSSLGCGIGVKTSKKPENESGICPGEGIPGRGDGRAKALGGSRGLCGWRAVSRDRQVREVTEARSCWPSEGKSGRGLPRECGQ